MVSISKSMSNGCSKWSELAIPATILCRLLNIRAVIFCTIQKVSCLLHPHLNHSNLYVALKYLPWPHRCFRLSDYTDSWAGLQYPALEIKHHAPRKLPKVDVSPFHIPCRWTWFALATVRKTWIQVKCCWNSPAVITKVYIQKIQPLPKILEKSKSSNNIMIRSSNGTCC